MNENERNESIKGSRKEGSTNIQRMDGVYINKTGITKEVNDSKGKENVLNESTEKIGNEEISEEEPVADTSQESTQEIIVEDITKEEQIKDTMEFMKKLSKTVFDQIFDYNVILRKFDGHVYNKKMYSRYKMWSLNGSTNLNTRRGFERKGFMTVLTCAKCGFILDVFSSMQKRYIYTKTCKMCELVEKHDDGVDIKAWYLNKLEEEFSQMERLTKNNRYFTIDKW